MALSHQAMGGGKTLSSAAKACKPGCKELPLASSVPSSTTLAAGAYTQGPAEGAFPVSADSRGPEVQHVSYKIKGGHTAGLLD